LEFFSLTETPATTCVAFTTPKQLLRITPEERPKPKIASVALPMTPSFTSPCVLTTQLLDCLKVLQTSQWYLKNSIQLNPDKSEALVTGTTNQLQTTASATSTVSVAGVQLLVANQMEVLGLSHARSTRVGRGAIAQLPCMHHPPHPSSYFDRTHLDTGL